MAKDYKKVRFFLFCHSYSGRRIALDLKSRYKNKKLLKVINKLSVILGFKTKQIENFILLGLPTICPYQRLPSKFKIYLEIEKELINLTDEKQDEYSTAKDDYQNQLLFPAIERAAGNSLNNIKEDREFEIRLADQIKSYTNTYYKVAYKFKLPTIRVIAFLLRLASVNW